MANDQDSELFDGDERESRTAASLPSASKTGTTISELEAESQAMCPGKACTSGTMIGSPVAATCPQTPRPKGMRRQPSVP